MALTSFEEIYIHSENVVSFTPKPFGPLTKLIHTVKLRLVSERTEHEEIFSSSNNSTGCSPERDPATHTWVKRGSILKYIRIEGLL